MDTRVLGVDAGSGLASADGCAGSRLVDKSSGAAGGSVAELVASARIELSSKSSDAVVGMNIR